ncbi:hypothetical protein BFP72_14865 [Reichenbachiella sp. 5M10]|uniref:hypothetical protein n=1 Tax=Reichenbachiella sp. 5M10 TaxID=1889772 RepID=UPI000C150122|nr:hypothetical protein [Reichenbachiella sp. 5M10]PIB36591.1 hypothetical protein BFP72_14865 [Reichenbachiella sp. 5M10]
MVEVFVTDIRDQAQAVQMMSVFEKDFAEWVINFDLSDTDLTFPCGHSILRVEGERVNPERIINTMHAAGYICEMLEDKVCPQTTMPLLA